MSLDLYQICALLAVITFIIIAVFLVRFLMQATKTVAALEDLADNANDKVERTEATFELIESLSKILNNGTLNIVKMGAAFLGSSIVGKYMKRKRKKECEEEEEQDGE
ncbi:hypothetical protein Dip518_000742 [Parelusimicrobium proximum]|uniref:hypothetical protein n=1 Tax=Parelusimicrobium proximum TaxID=3228953 RepID=UPI003D1684DC